MSEQVITNSQNERKINPKIWRKLRKAVGEKEFANVINAEHDDQIRFLSNFYPPEKIFLVNKNVSIDNS